MTMGGRQMKEIAANLREPMEETHSEDEEEEEDVPLPQPGDMDDIVFKKSNLCPSRWELLMFRIIFLVMCRKTYSQHPYHNLPPSCY